MEFPGSKDSVMGWAGAVVGGTVKMPGTNSAVSI